MSQSTLLTCKGAQVVSREELDQVKAPEPTGTWFPLGHSLVLDAVTAALGEAGFGVRRTKLALSRGNARFFGTLDLEADLDQGVQLAVGVRNSIDKSFPIAFCGGARVLVCDNLSFHGEVTVARKHTKHGESRFRLGIGQAVQGLHQFRRAEAARIERFKSLEISDTQARALILTAYEKEIISHRLLPTVLQQWSRPEHPQFESRSMWSLENSFTYAMADVFAANPTRFVANSLALQSLLSSATGVRTEDTQVAMSA